jgi:hypothetical protein
MPYDLAGFGPRAPRPTRDLPPELVKVNEFLERHRDIHTVSALPEILGKRAWTIKNDVFGSGTDFLLVFLALGLFQLTAAGALAVATSVLFVLLYLTYWHVHAWSIYYLELYPVLCLVTALGLWRFLVIVMARLSAHKRDAGAGEVARSWFALFALALLFVGFLNLHVERVQKQADLEGQARFRDRLRTIGRSAIVFVRYRASHEGRRSLVENGDALSRSRVWVVHDRGEDNERLLRRVPDRAAYIYDEARGSLLPLRGGAASARIYNPGP